jgi:hypothetical protein
MLPSRKVGVGGFAGAVAAILLWILQEGFGVSVPAGIESAITTVVIFSVSYLIPEGKNNDPNNGNGGSYVGVPGDLKPS